MIQWWYRQKTYELKDTMDAREAIGDLYNVTRNILQKSEQERLAPFIVADQFAESRLKKEKTYMDFNWGCEG